MWYNNLIIYQLFGLFFRAFLVLQYLFDLSMSFISGSASVTTVTLSLGFKTGTATSSWPTPSPPSSPSTPGSGASSWSPSSGEVGSTVGAVVVEEVKALGSVVVEVVGVVVEADVAVVGDSTTRLESSANGSRVWQLSVGFVT